LYNQGEVLPKISKVDNTSGKKGSAAKAVLGSRVPRANVNAVKVDQVKTSKKAVDSVKKVVTKVNKSLVTSLVEDKNVGKEQNSLVKKGRGRKAVILPEEEIELDNAFISSDDNDLVEEIDLIDLDDIESAIEIDVFASFDGFDGGRAERLMKATGVDMQTAFHMKNTELFRYRDELKAELDEIQQVEDDRKGRLPNALRDRRRRLNLDLETVTWDIFEFNKGLVRSYVKKFTSNTSYEDSEDFMSAGSVGLMRAIDSFRVDQGRFGHWAYKPIQREVLRAVRDADYENMNPGDFEKRPDILRAQKELIVESGKEDFHPTLEAVAIKAGVTLKQADRVLNAPKLDSIHAPVGDEGDATVGDMIISSDIDLSDSVVSKLEVEALEAFGLSCLDRRELFVLARRFGLDCEPEQRLSAIGDMLGLSREAVRQVESKALAKLMHPTTLRKIARAGRA
jgi:RNA polymerase sigma factor (sigma-70 family)